MMSGGSFIGDERGDCDIPGVLRYQAAQLAAQLTQIEAMMIYQITPGELLHKSFEKPDKSPHLQECVQHFNEVTNWVRAEILSATKIEDRIDTLIRFIELAQQFHEMNNFSGVLQIMSALEITAISRLQATWRNIGVKKTELFERLAALANPEGNYRNYRAELAERTSLKKPFLPYVGCWMKDLTFIEEVPTMTEKNLLNWSKMEQIHAILALLNEAKTYRYDIPVDESVQAFLLTRPTMEESEQYRISRVLEPAGSTGKEIKIKGTHKTRERDRTRRRQKAEKQARAAAAAAAAASSSTMADSEDNPLLSKRNGIEIMMQAKELTKVMTQRTSLALHNCYAQQATTIDSFCDQQHQVLAQHLPLLFYIPRPEEPVLRVALPSVCELAVRLYYLQSQIEAREKELAAAIADLKKTRTANVHKNQLVATYVQQILAITQLLKQLPPGTDPQATQLVVEFAKAQLRTLFDLLATHSPIRSRPRTPLVVSIEESRQPNQWSAVKYRSPGREPLSRLAVRRNTLTGHHAQNQDPPK